MSTSAVLNDESITSMYRGHHRWLTGWLRQKLDSHERAADLAQDTFLRVLAARNGPQPREPRAYLTTIARGLVIDYYRRRELEQAYLQAVALLPEAQAPSPETRLLIMETLVRIDSMLDALPGKTRDIFLLSQLDGLTYADIALELNIALPTVKRHMQKAFRACLELA
ncbi:MAG: sigma-70 family RNA polymerase sigma factor [Haliea sp.]|nr:MAG: sigma-70 family RNA polymerase sigma factor [Haliea sp.]